MPTVPLEFPVLVSPLLEGYHLRPLFLDHPEQTAKRFRDAADLLTKEVRRLFRGFEMERNNLDDLLWFAFNPKLTLESIQLEFALGQYIISGKFAVVQFTLKEHKVLCLPHFDNFFAIMSDQVGEHGSFIEQLTTLVYEQLQERRKKETYTFSPVDYYAKGTEFVTTISLQVNIKQHPFPFEESMDNWFASLTNQQQRFEGATEIARVGSNWRDNYPHQLHRAMLRDAQVTRLSKLIFSSTMTATVILGTPGCGRTTLLQEAFYRYLNQETGVAKPITIWHIDPNRVIAGMSIVGMWQRRFEAILQYLSHGNKDKPLHPQARPRLFVDNLVALFRIGKSSQNSLTLSDVLKPYLEQRAFTFIAEASLEEWNVVMELDRRFADLCQVFRLNEFNMVDTARIAFSKRASLEQYYECEIDNEAMERIFALSHSLLRNTAKPGNIVNFLERLAAKHRHSYIGVTEVEFAISDLTRLNSVLLDRQLILPREEVQQALADKLIGQEEAVNCLVDVIQTVKAGLTDPKKPMATLLFIGPTGVGKTQAAKVLTRYLFTDETSLIRLDMNEFVTEADIGRLIGDWMRPEGMLTSRIRHQPFSILLLDEIEKAHSAIHDLLLQLLGEGRLTDALGRTTDFTHTIIILTSNLGAEQASRQLGFVEQDVLNQASGYKAAVEEFFRPELLNRIDRMVVFKPLKLDDAVAIARLQLQDLLQRDGFVRRTTILNISERALMEVAQRGFDALLGGRALKRAIERDLTTFAATQLVSLTATQPIILDIDWVNERLQPNITALVPIVPKTDVLASVERALTLANIEQLLELVIDLRQRLYVLRDAETDLADISISMTSDRVRFLLALQDTVFEVKEQLEELNWALEMTGDSAEAIITMIRQPTPPHPSLNIWKAWSDKRYMADFYAHQEIRDYLEEMYVVAPKLIRDSHSQWLNLLVTITFLNFFCGGLEQNQFEEVNLILQARVHGGERELDYLLNNYQEALSYIGIETTLLPITQSYQRQLQVKGIRLRTLLGGEIGIHLFHPTNENAIPIQVYLQSALALEDALKNRMLSIVRSYALPMEAGRIGVISDLSAGILNRSELTAEEWAFLWYLHLNSRA